MPKKNENRKANHNESQNESTGKSHKRRDCDVKSNDLVQIVPDGKSTLAENRLKRSDQRKNQRIGELGEKFIQQRLDLGIEFEGAWDEWTEIEKKLRFILLDCPEISVYDNRNITDVEARAKIREAAQRCLGENVRSADVSVLGSAARHLNITRPLRPYRMDRCVAQAYLDESISQKRENGIDVSPFLNELESGQLAEKFSIAIEEFATEHSLWAVPHDRIIELFFNHAELLVQGEES